MRIFKRKEATVAALFTQIKDEAQGWMMVGAKHLSKLLQAPGTSLMYIHRSFFMFVIRAEVSFRLYSEM